MIPNARPAFLPPALLTLLLAFAALLPAAAQARTRHVHHASAAAHRRAAIAAPAAPGQAMILMDSDTGLVLAQSNPDMPLHPASLTKTMTLLLTFEALDSGRLHIRDAVPISVHAADMPPSKLGLRPGQAIAAEDAIYAVVTHSCNDIAVALAEKIGGNEPNFVAMMNRRAAQLGMVHTHFINANGLHNPMQFSSARDMAILAHYIIQAHPQEYRYFGTRTFIYHGTVYQNHNHLMETYPGMDGLKTGFIQQSGFNLIASARQGNRRLIGVIFGGRSTASRNAQMAALLDWGFAHDGAIIAAAQERAAQAAAQAQRAAPIHYPPDAAAPYVAANDNAAAAEGQGDRDAASDIQPAAPAAPPLRNPPSAPALANGSGAWSIQLGAFDSAAKGDALLAAARSRLPPTLQGAQAQTLPLQTANGWIYRARLTGYSQTQAFSACQLLADCVPVPPAR